MARRTKAAPPPPPIDASAAADQVTALWRGTRPRRRVIHVWLTDAEYAEISERAALGGLSLSGYLRTAGLNHPIRSQLDFQAVRDLVAVAGDLGRLGGLLKLWLADRRGVGATVADVNGILRDTRALQDQIRQLVGRV